MTNKVRQQIGHNLVDALHQCNLADVEPPFDMVNDLHWRVSMSSEAYGHIAMALSSMGFGRAREVYASEGSVSAAHAEIDKQYEPEVYEPDPDDLHAVVNYDEDPADDDLGAEMERAQERHGVQL